MTSDPVVAAAAELAAAKFSLAPAVGRFQRLLTQWASNQTPEREAATAEAHAEVERIQKQIETAEANLRQAQRDSIIGTWPRGGQV